LKYYTPPTKGVIKTLKKAHNTHKHTEHTIYQAQFKNAIMFRLGFVPVKSKTKNTSKKTYALSFLDIF
jgi:hypothetical protein